MNAEVTLRSKGCTDHLRLFWQAAESLLEEVQFEEDPAQTRFNILVSLQEATSNVLRHGFGPDEQPDMELVVHINDTHVEIQLRDRAVAFDPTSVWAVPDTSDPMAIPEGCYGIHMMREVLDEIEYRYEDGQNILVLKKAVVQVRSEV